MSDTDEGSSRNTTPKPSENNTPNVSPIPVPRLSLPVRF